MVTQVAAAARAAVVTQVAAQARVAAAVKAVVTGGVVLRPNALSVTANAPAAPWEVARTPGVIPEAADMGADIHTATSQAPSMTEQALARPEAQTQVSTED